MAGWIVALVAAFLVAATAGPVAAQDDRVSLTVLGPSGHLPTPHPDYTLEVGSAAWTIDPSIVGGGLITVPANGPLVVRLRLLSTCAPVVRFVAQPGSSHVIRFLGSGTFRVEDWTKNGLDALGGFPPAGPLVCPRLPDTATAGIESPPSGGSPGALLALAFLLGLFAVARRLRQPAAQA